MIPQLTQRSQEKELMDLGPDFYTQEEYVQCLKLLFKIDKLLGAFNTTVKFLKRFPDYSVLVDVGCGGGLFLLNLSNYFPNMQLIGTDISAEAITLAQNELQRWKKNQPNIKVEFQLQLKPELNLATNSVDFILLNLVCHHLSDDELILFLKKALDSARVALIINDLNRSAIAYWFYKMLSPLLFRNRLITHDGLVSIQRSFKRKELKALLKRADIKNYQIKWCFPYRWNVIVWKKD